MDAVVAHVLLIFALRIFTLDGGEFFKEHASRSQRLVTMQLSFLASSRSLNRLHVNGHFTKVITFQIHVP